MTNWNQVLDTEITRFSNAGMPRETAEAVALESWRVRRDIAGKDIDVEFNRELTFPITSLDGELIGHDTITEPTFRTVLRADDTGTIVGWLGSGE